MYSALFKCRTCFHLFSIWASLPLHEFEIIKVLLRSLKRRRKGCLLHWGKNTLQTLAIKACGSTSLLSMQPDLLTQLLESQSTHRDFFFLISLLSIINRKPTENKKYRCQINTKAYFWSVRYRGIRYITAMGGYLTLL